MSEAQGEGFLARWARRKRQAVQAADARERVDAPDNTSDKVADDVAHDAPAAMRSAAEPPAIDPCALPPIESITATTDVRPFLAPGVPPEITRAALRRAWVADPQIRDFIGIAENQWDFNDPNGVPGFGPLGPLDDVAKLVARVVDGMDKSAGVVARTGSAAPDSSLEPAAGEKSTAPDTNAGENTALTGRPAAAALVCAPDVQRNNPAGPPVATQDKPEKQAADAGAAGSVVPRRRGHGGALPS